MDNITGPKKMITMEDMLGENNDVYINIEYLDETDEYVNDEKNIDVIEWVKNVLFGCCDNFRNDIG
jgi:hypothetical protein